LLPFVQICDLAICTFISFNFQLHYGIFVLHVAYTHGILLKLPTSIGRCRYSIASINELTSTWLQNYLLAAYWPVTALWSWGWVQVSKESVIIQGAIAPKSQYAYT